MDDRIEEFVMREELVMLTAAELDVKNCRPTDLPEPRRVYAWVRYLSKAIRVQAHEDAYTPTAVRIDSSNPSSRFSERAGTQHSSDHTLCC
jgi:hypothetical protein